jgi:cytoskeletal protein RodZ
MRLNPRKSVADLPTEKLRHSEHSHNIEVNRENKRVSTFGAQLKLEREKQGVTLEEISLSTKIGTRMLRALEEEHFDQLPGGIFNKGFIRAYARCIGLDEDQAVADYLAATGVTPLSNKFENNDQAPILEPPSREGNSAAGLPWGAFAVVLLIVALGFAAWGFYSRESERTARDATSPATSSPSATPAAGAETSAQRQAEPADSSSATPQPDQQSVATKSPAETAAAVDSVPASTPPATKSQLIASTNPPLQLIVKAREDSWLSVSVDGEIVTRTHLTAPAQKAIRAQNEIVVRAGNVGALDFEFNGKKLPTQGDYGEAKTLTFDARGLQPAAPKSEAPQPDAAPSPQ